MHARTRPGLPDRLLEAGIVLAFLAAFYTLTGILR